MPTQKTPYFFRASQSVDEHIGNTTSFIWASYAGLRELWWQVRGYKTSFPGLHIIDIEKKFLSGLPLPGGIDLNHICIETEWNIHEEGFARWLLFDACTIYEGWAEKVCSLVFSGNQIDKCAKQIQFPRGVGSNGQPTGFPLAIQLANQNKSNFIFNEFFPVLSTGKFNKWSTVDELLIGYRFFKECRNSFIHSDGNVTTEVVIAQSNFSNVLSLHPTLLRQTFTLAIGAIGEKIQLNIKDVLLFTRIVKHLISTFDAALCVSAKCEDYLEARLKELNPINRKWDILPKDQAKRKQRIHRMLSASRIPEPTNIINVEAWMISKGIIK